MIQKNGEKGFSDHVLRNCHEIKIISTSNSSSMHSNYCLEGVQFCMLPVYKMLMLLEVVTDYVVILCIALVWSNIEYPSVVWDNNLMLTGCNKLENIQQKFTNLYGYRSFQFDITCNYDLIFNCLNVITSHSRQ